MNLFNSTRQSFIAMTLTLAVVSASAQSVMEGAARIVRLKGAARVSSGNFVWHAVKVGDVLRPGTIVQTSADPGAYVDLALGDGKAPVPQPKIYRPSISSSMDTTTTFQPASEQDTLRLWGDGALGIDKLSVMQTGAGRVTETQLDLKRGRVTGNVKKLTAASKYEIKMPNGVAGVRGTVFDIQATGLVRVYVGSLVVAWVDPTTQNVTTQTVMGGQAYDASLNRVTLLSMDSISELGQLSSSLLVVQPYPASTTLAPDRTVVGMSPVGANPATLPTPVPLSSVESSGVGLTEVGATPPVVLGQ